MADTVADKSGFLRMYMSSHPDTLVAYVKHYGKVQEAVSGAEMSAIDSKSMTLKYKLKAGGEAKEIRIPLEPPLSGYEEVKPRLLGMKADAQEALGMIRTPQITTFRLPWQCLQTVTLLLFLSYCTWIPAHGWPTLFGPARFLSRAVGGPLTIKLIWIVTGLIHLGEALYTLRLCIKHRTGFTTGAQYVVSNLLFGFPVLIELRKKIQDARIESVMKVE